MVNDLLSQASRLINQQLNERLKKTGVTLDGWRILTLLGDSEGLSMGDLAEQLVINNPTLTKMIDRMVNDNLVYRVPDIDDRRKVMICATDSGRQVQQAAHEIVQRQQQQIELHYQYSPDLTALLRKLIGQLRNDE